MAARRQGRLDLSRIAEEPAIAQHDSPRDAPGAERTEPELRTTDLAKVRATLWAAADELRANSKLTPVQYRDPVLGLVFLAYAENRFEGIRAEVESRASARNPATVADYKAKSVLYVPDESRLSYLVGLPEGDDIGKAVDDAIKAIEATNPELKDILPRGYQKLERPTLIELLRLFAPLPTQLEGDAFGFIYEDFLSNFAAQEGKGGGEYFTPYSIVRLIVEILEPFQGRVFDPACGSGGMFVQCAKFVERHHDNPTRKLSVFGTEKTEDTVPLAKMNLALHGLSGDIRQANSYYEDPHRAVGAFDYVMANPPFNVDKIKKEQLAGDKRFPFGLPKADNGNYLWIQQFYAALAPTGRAGFVMANSAGDAGHSEKEIRKQLVESGAVDVMIAIGSNFFYTVTLPVTLWFLDKAKLGTPREDTVLFIDARHIYNQIDRAHRDFMPEQIEFLANIVRLYRGEDVETVGGSEALLAKNFPDGQYADVAGLCKVAKRAEIEAQGWSLNPGRYTGSAVVDEDDEDFAVKLEELYEEFTLLSNEADALRAKVDAAVQGILDA
ncbi:type I restriction-modification system subunit M [Tessaracoccus flavescens]|uniref:type I restriction-modification system subunit M n=1 Tax=Tessaracoccus flavescens TaxID=399497 RepID=UPI001F36F83C|nr:class I SAM-dependent DNA methyltransferase [Tessaracoccus flavescens]